MSAQGQPRKCEEAVRRRWIWERGREWGERGRERREERGDGGLLHVRGTLKYSWHCLTPKYVRLGSGSEGERETDRESFGRGPERILIEQEGKNMKRKSRPYVSVCLSVCLSGRK